jgi:hypothetical protein
MPDYGMLSSGLSSFHALARNPGTRPATRRLERRRRRRRGRRLRAAAPGHRHRRLDPAAGRLVRRGRLQAELRPRADPADDLRPRGRTPLAHGGRRRAGDAELARPDARDPMRLPPLPLPWLELERDPRGCGWACCSTPAGGCRSSRRCATPVLAAARTFESAGAVVEPMAPFTTRAMADGIDRWFRLRSWVDLQALPPRTARAGAALHRRVGRRGRGLRRRGAFRAWSQWQALREACVAACEPYDYVLSPVSPVASFPAEWAMPSNDPARSLDHVGFTLPCNVGEQPAVSVDAGVAEDGVPIGLQIAGRRFDDLGVLRVARAWERMPAAAPAVAAAAGKRGRGGRRRRRARATAGRGSTGHRLRTVPRPSGARRAAAALSPRGVARLRAMPGRSPAASLRRAARSRPRCRRTARSRPSG